MNMPELRAHLQQLQQAWQTQWPGLESVVQTSIERMGLGIDLPHDHTGASLARCMTHLAQLIESDGLHKAQLGKEPTYHNRLHMAQAFVSMSCLLMSQRYLAADTASAPTSEALAHRELLALLAMLAHDLFHPGLQNQAPKQIEQLAVDALQPHLNHFGVSAQDQADVFYIILHTDPASIPWVHEQCANRPFDVAHTPCLSLLAVEADILASALPDLGPKLTQFLAQEWAPHYPQAAQNLLLPSARAGFLKHLALFSSPASKQLGMPALVQAQIHEAPQCSS